MTQEIVKALEAAARGERLAKEDCERAAVRYEAGSDWHAGHKKRADWHGMRAAALESLLAEREELLKDQARLAAAVRLAKREIITLTENATDLIRLHRGDCDDAEKTYGPTIARIDAVMKGEA